MQTARFLSLLRENADRPLVFAAARSGDAVSPGYHLTEVKQVTFDTMDCGAMRHRWTETHFELWVPPVLGNVPGRSAMRAEKFLHIVERVEAELPLDPATPARIHAGLGTAPAALYDIEAIDLRHGVLTVQLAPDRTRCKSAERRLAAGTGGCCGPATDAIPAATDAAPAGCCA